MKPYPKTKASGVEWLGKVPEHWDSLALKRHARRYAGGTPDRNNELYWENGTIPWINSGAVNQRFITEPSAFITQEGYANSSAKYVPLNALVMALAGQGKTKGMVAQMGIEATCNQSMAAICPRPPIQSRYLYWLLVSQYEHIRNMAGGEQRDGLNLEILGNIPCLLPSEPEQTAIGAYLDRETGRMDTLVGKKRELIERLKEKRTALISRTVTRGLPAGVPLETLTKLEEIAGQKIPLNPPVKTPKIDWINNVPEHWTQTLIKRVVSVRGRIGFRGYTTDDLVDEGEGALVLGGANLSKTGRLDLTKRTYLSWFKYDESPEIKVASGDLIIGQRGTCGNAVLINSNLGPTTINPSLVLLKQPKIDCEFLCYWLMGKLVRSVFDTYLSATAVPMLSQAQIGNVPVCHPPLSEQRAIVAYLDEETAKLDALQTKVETAIERLQEYRTALITAAVTGKIDVREEVAV